MNPIAIGRLCVWPGGSLWIGRAVLRTNPHAHHAIQTTFALKGSFLFRVEESAAWKEYTSSIVPPNQLHAFDGNGSLAAHIFVEPESEDGKVLQERHCADGVTDLPDHFRIEVGRLLLEPFTASAQADLLAARAREAVRLMTGGIRPSVPTDSRVLRAIELLYGHIDLHFSLEDAASAVYLSPGRFRHLFVQETGMPFRPYLLWMRLNRALEVIAQGRTITEAAHASGFADSAHLTRTFRKMFGLAPTQLALEPPRKE